MRVLQGRLCLSADKKVRFYDSYAAAVNLSMYELIPEDEVVVSDDVGRELFRGKVGVGVSPLGVCPIDWMMWAYSGFPAAIKTEHKSISE